MIHLEREKISDAEKQIFYFSKLGMVMHACNPTSQGAETKPLAHIQVQPYLSSEFPI